MFWWLVGGYAVYYVITVILDARLKYWKRKLREAQAESALQDAEEIIENARE